MQTEILKVTGMNCGGCVNNVMQALQAVNGVGDVTVSLLVGEATVQYNERLTSPEQLKSAVKGAGYGVNASAAVRSHQTKGSGCCCG